MLIGMRERMDVARTGTLFRNNPILKVSSGENVLGIEFKVRMKSIIPPVILTVIQSRATSTRSSVPTPINEFKDGGLPVEVFPRKTASLVFIRE
jgi:hypothetical protein